MFFLVPEVKSRFKALREKYRREIIIEEKLSRSGAPSSSRPTWALMSFFKFMYKCGQEEHRATTSNFLSETESDIENFDVLEEIIINNEDNNTETSSEHNYSQINDVSVNNLRTNIKRFSESVETPTTSKKKKLVNSPKTNEIKMIDNVLNDVSSAIRSINQNVPQQHIDDKYDYFSKFLSLELKELGEPHSSILMEQIQIKIINFKSSLRNKNN